MILGLGAYRLLRRGVLVRRLNAEETLGAVDLIMTDKTGTLTQNRLAVASVADARRPGRGSDRRAPALLERGAPGRGGRLAAARRSGRARSRAPSGRPSSRAGGSSAARPRRPRRSRRPPSDAAPVTRDPGAPGRASSRSSRSAPRRPCSRSSSATTPEPATCAWLDLIEAVDRGRRARRRPRPARRRRAVANRGPWSVSPIRSGAGIAEAMTTAREAGIQVVVVTGDHPLTAAAIAREAGLAGGPHRDRRGGRALGRRRAAERELAGLHVVARSTPDQKRRIVRRRARRGRIVAVTGDGVNDAPALHGADVAVAMGSGTAVAREASDLVLGDDSFATLMFGLAEGRRIVDNVQKGLVFLISTHVAFLGFILISTIFIAERQVLIPIQILWMELFIDLVDVGRVRARAGGAATSCAARRGTPRRRC